jgi:hypothetical protein
MSNDNVTICTNSNIDKGSMSANQLQEFLSTLKQIIQSEICKKTAVLEEKLTAEITKQSAESAKQTAALVAAMDSKLAESLIARFESANTAIREELNA